MPSVLGLIERLILSPPHWILVIFATLLAVHLIDWLIKKYTKRRGDRGLLQFLETLAFMTLLYLTAKLFYEKSLLGPETVPWYKEPYFMGGFLLFASFMSMIIYAVAIRLLPRRGNGRTNRQPPKRSYTSKGKASSSANNR